jgi:hypothetical protein
LQSAVLESGLTVQRPPLLPSLHRIGAAELLDIWWNTINPDEQIRVGRYDFSENLEGVETIVFGGTVRVAIERFGSQR